MTRRLAAGTGDRPSDREGRHPSGAPLSRAAADIPLGERGLANRNQQVMPHFSSKHVVLLLEPSHRGFQVTYSLLQAAHL